jgi:hypothetical protein
MLSTHSTASSCSEDELRRGDLLGNCPSRILIVALQYPSQDGLFDYKCLTRLLTPLAFSPYRFRVVPTVPATTGCDDISVIQWVARSPRSRDTDYSKCSNPMWLDATRMFLQWETILCAAGVRLLRSSVHADFADMKDKQVKNYSSISFSVSL